MEPIVKITGLRYAYRGHETTEVLRGIDLEIQKGEFLAIAGRTGSGKSTLCYSLNGLVPHSFGGKMEGSVIVSGTDTQKATPAELAQKVGIVLQSAESQIVGLTVEEDVEYGLENLALPVDVIIRRREEALEIVEMTAFKDVSPWNLSGGQKQRVAIAAALAFRPEILVLDNPTAELDPIGKEEVLQTIAHLNRDMGITIVIVDQELQEIIPYADRIAIMDDCKILVVDTPEKVLDQAGLLREAGIKLPDVTEIAYQLRKDGQWPGALPVDLETTRQTLKRILPADFEPGLPIEKSQVVPGEPLIVAQKACFNYSNGKPVLKDVDLEIHRGEFIALMGQNGAGKTTLAKHLNGLLKPTAGKVIVEGLDTHSVSISRLSSKVGYVFQNPDHQIFSKNVAEELAFGPRNLKWDEKRIEEAVQKSLKDIGMEGRGEDEPFFMGLAERKLIAIASVLIMEPDVLVLDEPATGADFGVALRIMRYICGLHQKGLTVVIITHDVSLAANYTSRMLVLNHGHIALDGPAEEVFAQKELLRECHISLPQVTELSNQLQDCGIPGNIIRVPDMVQVLKGGQL
ncbi:ATPase components of various ABC-type transport systems, contain duplicated ATPase [Longilinea arvoryzae]|uniref:ATPase components of various ABC-type transport systems, contain duplicated ATPase n=1 Tax=Longilinea arvoryzae TaxID=360412 RepID=A0A0S7B5Z7_9CHLR|nr:energy-coupling factor transporter ATPase [Longilinea arvoryzae]GAP12391.1 ATPase components of various ABC-type transport systems, contain duplicated ATPase [Longilinea arvoryzae]